MTNYLWVVEMFDRDEQRWMPTTGAGISRKAAREEKKYYFNENDPHLRFRVVKYVTTKT